MELTFLKIAIVDDHELFSLGVKSLIADFVPINQIWVMHDGKDFIEFLEAQHSVDLLLVDLQMPAIDGKEVIRYLKEKKSAIKIIVISMHNDVFVVEECRNLGADGFIKKDSSTLILKKGIKTVMQGLTYFPILETPESIPSTPPDFAKAYNLTKREIEIIKMIKNNYSSHQIAELLHISYQTVKTHRKNINHKLDINNVVALIDFANKYKL